MIGKRIFSVVFYVLIFFLPTQFGKHFWFDFSYVLGIRIDYLSVTIYLTDVLLLLLVGQIVLFQRTWVSEGIGFCKKHKEWIFLTVTFILVNISVAKEQALAVIGVYKLLEMGFFCWYVAHVCQEKKVFYKVISVFVASVIFQIGLGVTQVYFNSSVNGLWYFLGERTFTTQTPGIALWSYFGHQLLRAYGTFPHPNVFAAYAVICLLFLLTFIRSFNTTAKKILLVIFFVVIVVGIGITASRAGIFIASVVCGITLLHYGNQIPKKRRILFWGVGGMLLGGIALFIVNGIRLSDQSIIERMRSYEIAAVMFREHSFFGVGINNYLTNIPQYDQNRRTIFIQPVHSLFLYALVQGGIFGFVIIVFWIRTFKLYKNLSYLKITIILCVIGLSVFDHYFLSVQQGQLLYSFLGGLLFIHGNEKTVL